MNEKEEIDFVIDSNKLDKIQKWYKKILLEKIAKEFDDTDQVVWYNNTVRNRILEIINDENY